MSDVTPCSSTTSSSERAPSPPFSSRAASRSFRDSIRLGKFW
ncbi:hypothetical protein A2U01_0073068, partial [Trifolium medium]|nr:hypothetical protein [Trifolium medium]